MILENKSDKNFLISKCSFETAYKKMLDGFEVVSLRTGNRYKTIICPISKYIKLYILENEKWKYRGYIQTQEMFNEWKVMHNKKTSKSVNCEDLNIDIKNDTVAFLRIKNSNKHWIMHQITKDGIYYSFDNKFERVYIVDEDMLCEYDIEIVGKL